MQAIAAMDYSAKLQSNAIDIQICIEITLGNKHTDLVVPRRYVTNRARGQVTFIWSATAENYRHAFLRHGHWFSAHDAIITSITSSALKKISSALPRRLKGYVR
jgi:hypothetical protein